MLLSLSDQNDPSIFTCNAAFCRRNCVPSAGVPLDRWTCGCIPSSTFDPLTAVFTVCTVKVSTLEMTANPAIAARSIHDLTFAASLPEPIVRNGLELFATGIALLDPFATGSFRNFRGVKSLFADSSMAKFRVT